MVVAREGYESASLLASGKATILLLFREEDWATLALGMRIDTLALRYGCAVRKVALEGEGALRQFEREGGTSTPVGRVYSPEGRLLGQSGVAEEIEGFLRR